MATPHPGRWELLLSASKCELNVVDPAIHAAVVANRNTGVATHATNMDQRSVGLSFLPVNGTVTVTAPASANVAPPGLYMLFVLLPKAASLSGETMIPSVAKIVQVKRPSP